MKSLQLCLLTCLAAAGSANAQVVDEDAVVHASSAQPEAVSPGIPQQWIQGANQPTSGGNLSGCTNNSLTTTFASNNGGAVNWMTMMDLDVTNPAGVDVIAFDINDNNGGTSGNPIEIDIYTTAGGVAGKQTNPGAWTLVATGTGTSMPEDTPTFVDTSDFNLASGLWGIAIHYRIGDGPAYTNGDGTNEVYTNCDMTLTACCSVAGFFTGTVFSPRVFNGTVYTCSTAPATTYCTAKSPAVCGVPAIGAGGCSSASATSGFEITASPARGNRSGVLLYTDAGPAAIPFQGGILCINPTPLRRSSPINSGGTAGLCDGVFRLDMNCFAAGNCGGNPEPYLLVPGQQVNVQFWGRDSVATGSLLSDGLEYVVGP